MKRGYQSYMLICLCISLQALSSKAVKCFRRARQAIGQTDPRSMDLTVLVAKSPGSMGLRVLVAKSRDERPIILIHIFMKTQVELQLDWTICPLQQDLAFPGMKGDGLEISYLKLFNSRCNCEVEWFVSLQFVFTCCVL